MNTQTDELKLIVNDLIKSGDNLIEEIEDKSLRTFADQRIMEWAEVKARAEHLIN